MTIREINPAKESAETKHRPNAASRHRPNATTNSVLPPLKPTPHSDHNNTTPQPLRAKRKSLSTSNQGHNNNGDEGRVPAPDRDQEASMQDSTAQSWEDRRMTTKQLRLTAVDSGRRRRTSTCNQSLPSYSSSSPSSSPNSATPQSTASNSTEHSTISPPSTHTPGSNGSLVDEMDLDAHLSSPSTVSVDVDVASLSDTLDVSILEEDLLVRQFRDLSSPPSPPSLLQDSRQPPLSDSFKDNDNQTLTHQLLLEDARAEKRVDRKEQQPFTKPTPSVLPTELLIKVFEWLAGYQSDLCSAALVSIEWNLCATGQLYRYPEFANTIHWAMFIQTLCKNKEDELERPTSRRYRPPIITPTCLSTLLGDHPPILLAPGRMANFGARTQQSRKRDRLDRTLGEYVRGIDLSRRAIGASRLCSCGRPYGPPVAMKECSVCSRPGKGSHSKPVVGSTIRGASGKTSTTQDNYEDGSEIDDGDMGVLDNLTIHPSLAAMREGFQLGSQQTSNVRLGQSGQLGFDIAGFDPASNDTSSMLEWSELRLSSTTDFGCLIRPIAATRTNSATAAATSSTISTATTTPTAAASSSSSATTTAGPSLIALARSRQLAVNRSRGEQRLASQDAASQSNANIASPSEGGGSGNRGKVVVEKDASSTRKPMMITVSSLIQMARHCPNLEWLCLASTALADDTLYLETGDYMSTLQPGPRTGLTNVQVTVMEGIGALGQSCLNLRRVWLVGCDWVTHREVLALTASCRRLQMMDVRHCARLEGRLSRLYTIMEGQDNNDDESLKRAEEMDAENDVIRNERVAMPLNFETAPTTVLLGASVSGRRVRDGAMDDLFYWVYITSVVSSSGTSSTAAATAIPTTSTTTSTTPPTYNPQAVNEILSLLSSVALAREAPTDPLAFREWFKAIQDYDLVSYQPLKRLKSRYPMGCRPGEQKINGGGLGGASSSSSTNSSGYNTTGVFFVANNSSRRIRRERRQQQGRSESDSDSEYDSDSSSGSGTISQQQQHHGAFGSSSDSDSHDDDSEDEITEENLAELDD
ncbi:hypothetical protein EC957_006367 [Mortierella hygrophila]|uniref:F-box domain-containing protein n=1 Tax=Mortierella hygrophila TaxID=979708 RepID=A0A9P6EY64_9FUNG|nr:hypothetical protein EC957_006367 [Mortierella hygrophila]